MRNNQVSAIFLAGLLAIAVGATLDELCTVEYVQSVIPADDLILGISTNADSVTANIITNHTVSESDSSPGASGLNACNITLTYSYDGRNETPMLWMWLPDPDQFQNRWLSTGGGGLSISSGESGLGGGLVYGAATGTTNGGFGGFDVEVADVLLRANGTMDYDMLYAFGYKAIHEMTVIGKELTKQFYNIDSLYSYYSGCSEGGREGWSQVQRYGDQFNGLAVGAPAMRQSFQQILHLFSATVEKTLGYAPSACEMSQINSDAISACDAFDGLQDGVVSRTDLCKLYYNVTDSIGNAYSCEASSGGGPMGGGPASSPSPAVNGTVSSEGAAVAAAINAGVFDTSGKQAWVSFQPSAGFSDASTVYNTETGEYEVAVSGIGVQFVNYFLNEVESTDLDMSNVTYDTLRDWMVEGMLKYYSTIETTWPDLEDAREAGTKIIHWHGESDGSIPAGSSVIYHEAVRRQMYPALGFNESYDALHEFYRLFLVPGAGHCGPSNDQQAPFPQDILGAVIDWVENDVVPETLQAIQRSGDNTGMRSELCSFPLRPIWRGNSTINDCEYDQDSLDSWFPSLDAIPMYVY